MRFCLNAINVELMKDVLSIYEANNSLEHQIQRSSSEMLSPCLKKLHYYGPGATREILLLPLKGSPWKMYILDAQESLQRRCKQAEEKQD